MLQAVRRLWSVSANFYIDCFDDHKQGTTSSKIKKPKGFKSSSSYELACKVV